MSEVELTLPNIAEAFDQAATEQGLVEQDDGSFEATESGETPAVEDVESSVELPNPQEAAAEGEQASDSEDEQPTETDELDSILDELTEETPQGELSWETQIEVPTADGTQRMSLGDLRDGWMRQADYTRKTQELAEQRKVATDAIEVYEAMRENPIEFAKAIAHKAGLVSEEGSLPEGTPFYTKAELDAAVAERVEEEVAKHPLVQRSQQQEGIQRVAQTLDAIGEKYEVDLTPKWRKTILQRASQTGVTNLETVYQSIAYEVAQRQQARDGVAATATRRPSAGADGDESGKPLAPVKNIHEAVSRAVDELETRMG